MGVGWGGAMAAAVIWFIAISLFIYSRKMAERGVLR